MKNYKQFGLIPLLLLFLACQDAEQTKGRQITLVPAVTIPEKRTVVDPKPVAVFSKAVADELNDWKFAVQVYETSRTFHYTVRLQYKELKVTDSMNLPNFGTTPKVVIQADSKPYSCTLGFLDKKGVFKPYKQASVTGNRLRFKTIASYYVASYQTPQKN